MLLFWKTLFQLSYDISFTLLTSKAFHLQTLHLTCTMTSKHTLIYISTNSTISWYSHGFGSDLWTFKSSIPLNITEYLLTSIHNNKLGHVSSKIHTLKSRHVPALCHQETTPTHTQIYINISFNLRGYFTKQHKYLPILSLNSQCTKPYNIKIKCKIIKICTHRFLYVLHVKFCPHTSSRLLALQPNFGAYYLGESLLLLCR